MLDEKEILDMLQAQGSEQQALFAKACQEREKVFGSCAVVRGVVEVGNACRVNCEFCPMRRDNTRDNETFLADSDSLVLAAGAIKESGINVVFFQAGEIPQTTRVVGEAIPQIKKLFDGDVEILLNLGNKKRTEYEYLREQGATSYILKHEVSDPGLNLRMRHETLESRLACMRDLLDLGYKVGTGGIIGLPGQKLEHIARDIILARDIGAHMCSFSPLIPAPNTPLASHAPGDANVTLNALAASRLVRPSWLIPSVSALAKTSPGGQGRGFLAGANVLTINFTPKEEAGKYLIYGRDRFVVRSDYATGLLQGVGLRPGSSVFAG